jgi:hypothetical protein
LQFGSILIGCKRFGVSARRRQWRRGVLGRKLHFAFKLRTSAHAVDGDWRAETALWHFGFFVEKSQLAFVKFSAAFG